MKLEDWNDDELASELKKRAKKKRLDNIPKPLKHQDFTKLQDVCEDLVYHLSNQEHTDIKAYEYDIYKTAIKAILGEDVIAWIHDQS